MRDYEACTVDKESYERYPDLYPSRSYTLHWWICDWCGATSGKVGEKIRDFTPRGWSILNYNPMGPLDEEEQYDLCQRCTKKILKKRGRK